MVASIRNVKSPKEHYLKCISRRAASFGRRFHPGPRFEAPPLSEAPLLLDISASPAPLLLDPAPILSLAAADPFDPSVRRLRAFGLFPDMGDPPCADEPSEASLSSGYSKSESKSISSTFSVSILVSGMPHVSSRSLVALTQASP